MKNVVPVLVAILGLFSAAGCHRTEKNVRTTAESFLEAFYAADYGRAAAYCTPSFATVVEKGSASGAGLPDEVAEKIKEAVAQTSFTIVSLEVDEEAGTAVVRYELSAPGLCGPVSKRLELQLEGRAAAVNGIE